MTGLSEATNETCCCIKLFVFLQTARLGAWFVLDLARLQVDSMTEPSSSNSSTRAESDNGLEEAAIKRMRRKQWWRALIDEEVLPCDPREWCGLQEAINMPHIRAIVLAEAPWYAALLRYGYDAAHWIHHNEPPTMRWNGKVWRTRTHEAWKFYKRNRTRADSNYSGCPAGSRPELASASPAERKKAELQDAFAEYKRHHAVTPAFPLALYAPAGAPAAATAAKSRVRGETISPHTVGMLSPSFRRQHGIVLWHVSQLKTLDVDAMIRGVLQRLIAVTAAPMTVVVSTGGLTANALVGIPPILDVDLGTPEASDVAVGSWLHLEAQQPRKYGNSGRSADPSVSTTSQKITRGDLMHFMKETSQAFLMLWRKPLPWCCCRICKDLPPRHQIIAQPATSESTEFKSLTDTPAKEPQQWTQSSLCLPAARYTLTKAPRRDGGTDQQPHKRQRVDALSPAPKTPAPFQHPPGPDTSR